MHFCIIYKLIKVTGYILELNETEHKFTKIMTYKKNKNTNNWILVKGCQWIQKALLEKEHLEQFYQFNKWVKSTFWL